MPVRSYSTGPTRTASKYSNVEAEGLEHKEILTTKWPGNSSVSGYWWLRGGSSRVS
jgi:hypothetical protein